MDITHVSEVFDIYSWEAADFRSHWHQQDTFLSAGYFLKQRAGSYQTSRDIPLALSKRFVLVLDAILMCQHTKVVGYYFISSSVCPSVHLSFKWSVDSGLCFIYYLQYLTKTSYYILL